MRTLLCLLLACGPCTTREPAPTAKQPSTTAPVRFDDPERVARIVAAARALEPALVATLEKTRAPGAAIGLVVDDQLVYFKGVGVREVSASGDVHTVDEDTVFRIASMSKAFLGASIVHLRDQGKLSLDDPADKYLPELRALRYPTSDSPHLTLRQLLSHSAGLPEDNASADLRMPMTEAAFDELLAHGLTFSSVPGTQYEYSNLGFALAGRIVSRVSGVSAQDYITHSLFAPLGMSATVWDGTRIAPTHLARGYGRKNSGMPAAGLAKYQDDPDDAPPHEEPMLADGAWAVSGGIWTSARDYTRWLAFQLAAWPARDEPDAGPVRRASIRETQSIQRFMTLNAWRDTKGELHARSRGYGLGWVMSTNCRFGQVVSHAGGLPGHGSYVVLLPDRGVAAFTMTNLTYTDGSDAASDLVETLDEQGLIPRRPQGVSPQLEAARADVLSLLEHYDARAAEQAFDTLYPTYESFAALGQRLTKLHTIHGACSTGSAFEAENLLSGHARLNCERGGIELSVTMTSDAPARIQSLALESVLPPSPRLAALGARAASLLSHWDESIAEELFPTAQDRSDAKGEFTSAALAHGACRAPVLSVSDGSTSATYHLGCEHGELALSLELVSGGAKLAKVELSQVDGGPRCPR